MTMWYPPESPGPLSYCSVCRTNYDTADGCYCDEFDDDDDSKIGKSVIHTGSGSGAGLGSGSGAGYGFGYGAGAGTGAGDGERYG